MEMDMLTDKPYLLLLLLSVSECFKCQHIKAIIRTTQNVKRFPLGKTFCGCPQLLRRFENDEVLGTNFKLWVCGWNINKVCQNINNFNRKNIVFLIL